MGKVQEKVIQKKIDEIAKVLLSPPENNDPSLFGDISGRIMFMFYYGRIYNDKTYLDLATKYLEDIFSIINSMDNPYIHYADGITGIQTMLVHLMSEGFISEAQFDIGDEIDDILFQHVRREIDSHSDDFLYGSLGILYYYILKYKYKKTSILFSRIFTTIDSIYEREFAHEEFECQYIDLGIPHGLSSMLIILSEIHELNVNKEKTRKILDKIYQYFKPFISRKLGYSFFPTVIEKGSSEKKFYSRLGWCYGDVSSVLGLLRYSDCTNNKELHDDCINMLKDTCYRKNLAYNIIRDSGICHGSAGLSYIYLYLYKKYKIDMFYKVHRYWLKSIFCFADHNKEGAAGFAAYTDYGYKKREDILTGIAGIGLVLISCITRRCYSWEQLFLL